MKNLVEILEEIIMKSYEKRIKNIEAKIKPKEPSYMERLDDELLQAKRCRATLSPEGREWLKVHRPLLDAMLDKVKDPLEEAEPVPNMEDNR